MLVKLVVNEFVNSGFWVGFARRSAIVSTLISLNTVIAFGCSFGAATETADPDFQIRENIEVIQDESMSVETDESGLDRRGGFLRVAMDVPWIPDPVIGIDPGSRMLFEEIYSGLTTITDDGSEPVQLELAATYEILDGGKSYMFVLREGLKFSDGSPLLAADVKWSWERALAPATSSDRAADILGDIAGAGSVLRSEREDLVGLEVVDERRLLVRLETPRADFLALLADPVASILKPSNVQEWDVDWARAWNESSYFPTTPRVLPVGAGPFKLTRFVPFKGPSVLERNEHYYARAAYLDFVELASNHAHTESGEHTVSGFDHGLFDVERTNTPGTQGDHLVFESAPTTAFIVFNGGVAPYDDVHFRRALVASFDQEVFDLSNLSTRWASTRASRIVPPNFERFGEVSVAQNFDPDLATELLAGARYDPSETFLNFHTFLYGLFEVEISQLDTIWDESIGLKGINYSPRPMTIYNSMMDAGELEILGFLIELEYPDPYAVLNVFIETFGEGNSGADAQAAERMLREAAAELDEAARLDKLLAAEQFILDRGLALPLYWSTPETGYQLQPWVHGFEVPKYDGSMFVDVWFDETAPKRDLPVE